MPGGHINPNAMSTIAVVHKNGQICMASESQTTFGSTKMSGEFIVNHAKIQQWGNSLIGMVGSVSLSMIFADIIADAKEEPDFSNEVSIFKYFTKLHKKLKNKYFLKPDEEEDDPVESSQYELVIANKHGIFGVHSLREVYHLSKYWAYGSGRYYALGAMHALYDLEGYSAERIAVEAVKAGVTFDDGSGGEVVVHMIPS